MVLVTERLPLDQMRTLPVSRFAAKTVFIVLTKTACGTVPTIELLARVVAFGFQDAFGQNLGWLNDRTRVRYWVSMKSENNHFLVLKEDDVNERKADKALAWKNFQVGIHNTEIGVYVERFVLFLQLSMEIDQSEPTNAQFAQWKLWLRKSWIWSGGVLNKIVPVFMIYDFSSSLRIRGNLYVTYHRSLHTFKTEIINWKTRGVYVSKR